MQGWTLEWRIKFQREATTRDSKRGQSGNTVIICTPLSKFLDPLLETEYWSHFFFFFFFVFRSYVICDFSFVGYSSIYSTSRQASDKRFEFGIKYKPNGQTCQFQYQCSEIFDLLEEMNIDASVLFLNYFSIGQVYLMLYYKIIIIIRNSVLAA